MPRSDEIDAPLTFPRSALPRLAVGTSVPSAPRLPYYRGAAVASLIIHATIMLLCGIIAVGIYFSPLLKSVRWYAEPMVRFPAATVMGFDALLLDGGISAGATAVQANGPVELGYLVCGAFGPLITLFLVFFVAFKRPTVYEPDWLTEDGRAPEKQRAVLAAKQQTVLGRCHRWVVVVEGPRCRSCSTSVPLLWQAPWPSGRRNRTHSAKFSLRSSHCGHLPVPLRDLHFMLHFHLWCPCASLYRRLHHRRSDHLGLVDYCHPVASHDIPRKKLRDDHDEYV